VSALEKQFKKIRKGVSSFTSHYLAVKNMQTNGILTEEDIISGAVARYCFLDIYESVRSDREKDKRKGKTAKRKAILAHCKWVGCWRVLRTSDKFSGAQPGGRRDCRPGRLFRRGRREREHEQPELAQHGVSEPPGRHQGRQADAVGGRWNGETGQGEHGGGEQVDRCAAIAHCALLF